MKVKLIVEGGSMKMNPAVSQQLGPAGVNLGKVIEKVNSQTSGFKGMKVPVSIDVDTKTKNFEIEVSSPPVSELIKKEINVEKASGKAGIFIVGNLAIEQIIKIAKMKMQGMLAKDLKAAVRLVVGSCVSMGVLVESRNPVNIEAEISEGKYDAEIREEKTEPSEEKKSELRNFFSEISAKQEEEAKAAEAARAQEEAKAAAAATAEAGTPAKEGDTAKAAKTEESQPSKDKKK